MERVKEGIEVRLRKDCGLRYLETNMRSSAGENKVRWKKDVDLSKESQI